MLHLLHIFELHIKAMSVYCHWEIFPRL